MTMSTGDNRRSAPQKSTTAAATGGEAPEASDGPVGGVLPVKKTTRPAPSSRTPGDGARSGSSGTGTAKGNGTSTASKSTGAAKSAGSTAPAKKATPGKSTATTTAAKSGGGARIAVKSATRSSETAKVEASVLGRRIASLSRATSLGKARRPVTAVRQTRNWGQIALYVLTGLVAIGIVFYGAWPSISKNFKTSWQSQAAKISGIHDYLQTNPEWFKYDPNVGNHKAGSLTYPIYPPVGGVHNPQWQDCMGDVYTAQIPNEQAVHSLEHGTVWITYNPSLPQDQIDKLASKVRGKEMMMMSPYPNLDSPISLQAWGYQLKVDNANDGRINDFINALRVNATQEPQAGCSGGITDTGTVPLDLPGVGM
jgi:hypothetical protein